jgi:hypothetical protein
MYTRAMRGPDGLGARFNIFLDEARKPAYNRPVLYLAGDSQYGFEVAGRRYGKPGLYDVYIEARQLPGDTEFLLNG